MQEANHNRPETPEPEPGAPAELSAEPAGWASRFELADLARYGITAIAVVLAFFVRFAVARFVELPPYITFYPVIFVSALYISMGAGILATGLGALMAALWVLPSAGHFALSAPNAVSLAIYCILGAGSSFSVGRYRRSREEQADAQANKAIRIERAKALGERKAAEATRAERQRLVDILETLPVTVCLLSPNNQVAFANRRFREQFGENSDLHCYSSSSAADAPSPAKSPDVLKTGKAHHWERVSPDGQTIMDVYNFPFTDPDGTPLILAVDVDLSEQRRAEAELRRKCQSLEELIEERTTPIAGE
jgi:PAS domain-containing protein